MSKIFGVGKRFFYVKPCSMVNVSQTQTKLQTSNKINKINNKLCCNISDFDIRCLCTESEKSKCNKRFVKESNDYGVNVNRFIYLLSHRS